jgi:predicted MFS family arabinose efflux permease
MGAWGAMGGVGGVTGVIAGGLITQYLGWEWTLFINVPIGIACAIAAARVLEHDERPEERRNFDALGAVVITSGLTLLTYGIVSTHEHGWGAAQTLIPMVAGVVLIAVFVLIERFVATRPLVDFSIFRARPVIGSNVVVFTLGAGAFAMWFLLSLYLQHVRLYSPVDAGLAMMPGALGVVGGSLLAARLTTRFGGGWVMTGGMALLASGLLWISNASPRGSLVLEIMLPLFVLTLGIGLTFVPTTIVAMAKVKAQQAGLASGVLNTSRQFGGTLSIAVLVTIAASRTASLTVPGHPPTRAALSAGYMHGLAVGAAFAAVGALAAFLLVARERTPVLARGAAAADIHS